MRLTRYFTDFLSFWNWLILISVFTYQFLLITNSFKDDLHKPFGLLIQLAVFYKGLTILRIFDVLASIIGIFNAILSRPDEKSCWSSSSCCATCTWP